VRAHAPIAGTIVVLVIASGRSGYAWAMAGLIVFALGGRWRRADRRVLSRANAACMRA
jgi:hypothetical protein